MSNNAAMASVAASMAALSAANAASASSAIDAYNQLLAKRPFNPREIIAIFGYLGDMKKTYDYLGEFKHSLSYNPESKTDYLDASLFLGTDLEAYLNTKTFKFDSRKFENGIRNSIKSRIKSKLSKAQKFNLFGRRLRKTIEELEDYGVTRSEIDTTLEQLANEKKR